MKRKALIIMLSSLLPSLFLHAQAPRHITVSEAIETATRNNSHIKIANLEYKSAHADFRQTDAIFLPQIELGYTALSTNNPLNAFGFLLHQQSVTEMDFAPDKLNRPGSVQDYSATVQAKLPLFNPDMIYARKGAKAKEEAQKYKALRTQEHIAFEVKKAYTLLQFSYQAEQILKGSLEDVKKIHESVSNFHRQGLLQQSDVLNAQVQVNTIESALAKAGSNILNASEALSLLMGVKEVQEVYKTDSLAQQAFSHTSETVSAARADMLAMQKAVEATGLMVTSTQLAYLPRINAFGTYQLNDSKPVGFNADSYLIGINLSWKIFTGNENRSKIKSYRHQRDKMQEELDLHIRQSQLELNKTQRELNDLSIEINKHTTSVLQATEALRILSDRHREGLTSTTDLLMSQAQLAQQQLALAQAVMSYNITQAYSDFLAETE